MAILTKGTIFADGDQITSTKLNNLVDSATFVAGSSGSTDDATLEVASGQLRVKTIQTGNLATGAVTTAKIADSSGASDGVTTAKLATGAVTTAKIADGAVTTVNVADANITAAKLDGAQSGTAPIFGARAWVRFNGNNNVGGTPDASNTARQLLGSGNVASVTKTATGFYTVAFTTALPSANYVAVGMRAWESGDSQPAIIQADSSTPQTASEFHFFATTTPSLTAANSSDIQIVFFG